MPSAGKVKPCVCVQGVGDAEVAAAGYAQLHEGISPTTAMAVSLPGQCPCSIIPATVGIPSPCTSRKHLPPKDLSACRDDLHSIIVASILNLSSWLLRLVQLCWFAVCMLSRVSPVPRGSLEGRVNARVCSTRRG